MRLAVTLTLKGGSLLPRRKAEGQISYRLLKAVLQYTAARSLVFSSVLGSIYLLLESLYRGLQQAVKVSKPVILLFIS